MATSIVIGGTRGMGSIISDHLSDILYVPTKVSYNNLKKENLHKSKIILITGNTVIESVKNSLKISKKIPTLKKFNLIKNKYFLTTLHRPETVDDPFRLKKLFIKAIICAYLM